MANILVVDDNRDVCKSLTRILKFLGHNGHYAISGPEALSFVTEQVPDLIILDVMMPGMDGMEVLAKLKQDRRTQETPVVMFSAITDENTRGKAIGSGAVDYWVKACVNFDELGDRVNRVLKVAGNN